MGGVDGLVGDCGGDCWDEGGRVEAVWAKAGERLAARS